MPWRRHIGLVFLAAVFGFPGSATFLVAQGQVEPPFARGAELYKNARALLLDGKLPPSEHAYLETLRLVDQEMAVKNSDALILAWANCRNELAELQFHLLKITEAKALLAGTADYLQRVIPMRPQEPAFRFRLAETQHMRYRGHVFLHDHEPAEAYQRDAVTQLKKIVHDHPDSLELRLELSKWLNAHGHALIALGRFQDAEAAYQESTRLTAKLIADAPKSPAAAAQHAITLNAHSFLIREWGRYTEAIAMMRQSIQIVAKLEEDFPDQPEHWHMLPTFYRNLSQPLGYSKNDAEVDAARREAIRLDTKLARYPEAAKRWVRDIDKLLGSIHTRDFDRLINQRQEMENLIKEVERDQQAGKATAYASIRVGLAKALRGLQGAVRADALTGRQEIVEAIAIADKLHAQYPDVPVFRLYQVDWRIGHGVLHFIDGNQDQAKKLITDGIARYLKFADDYPRVPELRYGLGNKLIEIAMSCGQMKLHGDALFYLKASHEMLKKLAADFPACPKYRRHCAEAYTAQATFAAMAGDDAAVEPALREGIKIWDQVIADFPTVPEYRHGQAQEYQVLGRHLTKLGKFTEAEEAYRTLLRIDQKLLDENPKQTQFHADLARGHVWLGDLKEKANRPAEAVASYTQAVRQLEIACKLNPRQRTWLDELRAALKLRAAVLLKSGKFAAYQEDLQRVKEIDELLDPPLFRILRAAERLRSGATAQAVKDADDLFENVDLNDLHWIELAAFYTELWAKTSEAAPKELAAARAVRSLRSAVERGLSRATLSEDVRFRPLAHHPEFKKMVGAK